MSGSNVCFVCCVAVLLFTTFSGLIVTTVVVSVKYNNALESMAGKAMNDLNSKLCNLNLGECSVKEEITKIQENLKAIKRGLSSLHAVGNCSKVRNELVAETNSIHHRVNQFKVSVNEFLQQLDSEKCTLVSNCSDATRVLLELLQRKQHSSSVTELVMDANVFFSVSNENSREELYECVLRSDRSTPTLRTAIETAYLKYRN